MPAVRTVAEIDLPQPFRWDMLCWHIGTSSYGNTYTVQDGVARRVLVLAGEPQLVEFSAPAATVLRVRSTANPPQQAVAALAVHLFSLAHDVAGFYAAVAGEAGWAPLLRRFHGLRLLQAPSLYEALATTVLGQQVNVAFATTLRRRFIAGFGPAVTWQGEQWRGFPAAEAVAACDPAELALLKMTRRKAEYLVGLAQAVAGGQVSTARLQELDDGAAAAALCALRGVGLWTAEVVLMRALGRTDLWPAADVGLMAAFHKVFGTAQRPDEPALRAAGAGWSPWRSYCALYLWSTLAHD